MANEEYIKKWLEGTLNEEEEKEFRDTADFRELNRLLNAVPSFRAPDYNVEAELKQVREQRSAVGKVISMTWVKPLLRVAAVFLVVTVGYLLFLRDPVTTIRTQAGEQKEVYLPDSSVVILNAASYMAYSKESWERNRQLKLEGEAFFKVARGSEFAVQTPAGVVSVLGTQFNVKFRQGYFDVTCYEGLVKVDTDQKQVELSVGKGFRNMDGEIQEYAATAASSPRWIASESYFQSVPFAEVIRELERQYDLSVEIKNVNTKQLFTGGFTHEDITLALRSISRPLDLSWQVVDDRRIILSGDND